MHHPVLLNEVLNLLDIKTGCRYIDATVGEGGHTKAILSMDAKVLGLDRDSSQIERLAKHLHDDDNLTLTVANFSEIAKVAKKNGFVEVDGILFDLGLSWDQLGAKGVGLSYRKTQEALDMRLDEEEELTAEQILNTYSEKELYDLFARNSEEIRASDIAKSIVHQRKSRKYKTVRDLNLTIDTVMGKNAGKTYSRIFQALRIEVNNEFENLKKGLSGAMELISKTGRIAVISFHSLEDRIVKQFIKEHGMKQINKKVVQGNRLLSFEKPAKLRVFSL
ncbi:16S rRNA (cytosine(1402)-N(4))-methyltransferase [Candidatus Roizmanbacteria bacterium RIFOXYB2_FULL_38_10]|uniref:Ribosomal RNA small subunit methyltransferase H n=1 Tax=Candidatus Roizmanbacteria bacterium RIFOXYD1_FULL_38_12 TaxID=1802093 RepID=A0A1F7L046_9BACT|nr:MAG: 16S rRNA (cytosine(1402)-N(4))-methyltransferase [Candidatus Roizmanbacteria bacterium RIFOXYA2_FULL_38_14]OGK63522.1 MAG: 16S rRNA (cytosine(1402)-N(4))-methyltransferase [Candidatus Roizmanbacteria bacterium RIFOXYA1_FULL_37_12]OGK65368.1 MAG: 16S rRNA (cytosine(1402)-N(4))-methyltransferase [Candidatus Roizmanbacteria bacterium RIFOXYB1_FULL_40_23]OGK67917.1 MAG: 16S rRNA (cytosine(1402)-N(4))-methyltransferase [Candidatus Roizmanbacteria bacterium RIFOXYB2_FULL_38_10]OGK69773.1 MAG: